MTTRRCAGLVSLLVPRSFEKGGTDGLSRFFLVMSRAIPRSLIDQVGLDTILERLPHTYAYSIFSSYVASVRRSPFLSLSRTGC